MPHPDCRRFFIALVPPEPLYSQARELQQYFRDRYASRAAQKSPPHITLQPPFEWSLSQLVHLEQVLSDVAEQVTSVPVTLDGFASFPPRVIYIHVERSPELLHLQTVLRQTLAQRCEIVDPRAETRPFTPHLTLAFRDLTRSHYHTAWAEFQSRSLQFAWVASELALLIHTGHHWIVHQFIPLTTP